LENALKILPLKKSRGPDRIWNEHLKHQGSRAKDGIATSGTCQLANGMSASQLAYPISSEVKKSSQ